MECLLAGTRHSLRRTWLQSSLRNRPFLLSHSHRYYALDPTPRRMSAHNQSDAHKPQDTGEDDADSSQAHPLSGYYLLILNSRSPYPSHPPTSRSTTLRPDDKPIPGTTVEPQSPQDKMSIVFGTRLAGPGRSSRYNPGEVPPESMWKTINGIPIPPRPDEPDNCCMSGCVHCVWDDFRDEMEEWAGRVENAKAKGGSAKGTMDMRSAPRTEVDSASHSMDDDGGGSETNWTVPSQEDDLFGGIPVGIREFMKTEKKLRVKHQKEATATP